MGLHNHHPVLLSILGAAPLWVACSSPQTAFAVAEPDVAEQDETKPEPFQPEPQFTAGEDWIKLVSGEWLRGELSSLNQDRIEFDSEELDELQLDWEDVLELVTDQPYTLLLANRTTVVGVPSVKGDVVVLTTAEGQREFTRNEIMGFVRGRPTESNYWSGHLRLGGTVRRGNTDQLDTVLSLGAVRRTAASRVSTEFDSVFSEVEGTETANNQAFVGSWDYYLTPRLYARPFGIEVLHDKIQNIDLRVSPYAAFGYMLVDRADMEWDMTAGLGYRSTEFDSVAMGEKDSNDTMTAVFATEYDWEITGDIDLLFGYGFQASLEDSNDTNHDGAFGLKFELPWDLDFDFRAVWRRVGQPEPDANGDTPDSDDLRLEIGLVWEF